MKVGLVGDLHGNYWWGASVLERMYHQGIRHVCQAGDFGIWHGADGAKYLEIMTRVCETLGMTLWVVPGNHEDYTQIEDPETTDGSVPPKQVLASGDGWEISLLPRGYRWEVDGKQFLAFGGAASIDRMQRKPGRDWWPEEMFRETDMLRVSDLTPGEIDVMITHESPYFGTKAVDNILFGTTRYAGWDYDYANQSSKFMTRVVGKVKPKVFVHGHMHVTDERFDEEDDCRYVSLGTDGVPGNAAILDTDTMKVEWGIDYDDYESDGS